MALRIAIALIALTNVVHACSCGVSDNVKKVKRGSDVVFRGTITDIRDGKVVFRVNRVWKGDLSEVFEMPAEKETSQCSGFWPRFLEVGNELLVYASRYAPDMDYRTSICTRTALVKDAAKDFQKLGPGKSPRAAK